MKVRLFIVWDMQCCCTECWRWLCIDKSCMGEDVISLLMLCISLGLQAPAGKESDMSLAEWAGDMLGLGCACISGRSQCCIP